MLYHAGPAPTRGDASSSVGRTELARGSPLSASLDPYEAVLAVSARLTEAVDADAVVYQRFVDCGSGPRHANVRVHGASSLRFLEELEGQTIDGLAEALDPRRTRPWLRDRLRGWRLHDRRKVGESSRIHAGMMIPAGFNDQARLVVYDGHRHVGYVSAIFLGDRALDPARARELKTLTPALRSDLLAVHARFGALPLPSQLVCSPDGEVVLYDRPIPEGAFGGELARWLGAAVRGLVVAEANSATRYALGLELGFKRLSGAGGPSFSVTLARLPDAELDPLDGLTDRQRVVVQMACQRVTIPEIADALGVSPNTIKTHLKRIYEALEVPNRTELIRRFAANGFTKRMTSG